MMWCTREREMERYWCRMCTESLFSVEEEVHIDETL